MSAVGSVAVPGRVPELRGPGGSTVRVALALARRNLVNVRRLPSAFVPVLVMPVFFAVAFSGQYSGVTDVPGFGTDNILSWYVPMAVLMGSSFSGVGTAQSVATEIEERFVDRLLLAPAPRAALVLGGVLSSLVRSSVAFVLVLLVGAFGGMAVPGGLLGVGLLWVTGLGVATAATLWGLGVVYRIQTQNAGPLMQVGMFVTLFFSTAQVPIDVMTGWLHAVARVNPMSNVLRLARAGFIDTAPWELIWPGFVAIAGLWVVLGLFAATGMRRLVP